MSKSRLIVAALVSLLGAPLFPATAAAQDRDDRVRSEQRFYDRDRRDYHRWNGDEDRRYREYLAERHRSYRDFWRLSQGRQREYWRWRHQHEERR
jgi:hypothetical protein